MAPPAIPVRSHVFLPLSKQKEILLETINQLYELLLSHREANPDSSYTARLLQNEDEILKKVGEESVEVILAAKG
jgi:hypothetical protein